MNSYRLAFCAISCFLGFYLAYSLTFLMPLGDDGIINAWPQGQWLSVLPLKDWPSALMSGYGAEDHVNSVHYLYGLLCYFLGGDPALTLAIMAKLLFLATLGTCLLIIHELWKDKIRVLLFFLFVSFNVSLTQHNVIFPSDYTLAAFFMLWAFFFLHRYLTKGSFIYLIGIWLFTLLGTLTHEVSFIGLPLLAFYGLILGWKSRSWKERFSILLPLYTAIGLGFLPYVLIHHYVYGSLIPHSRAHLENNPHNNPLLFYIRLITSTISPWVFDIPKYLIYQFSQDAQIHITLTKTREVPTSLLKLPALLVGIGILGAGMWVLVIGLKNKLLSPTGRILLLIWLIQMTCIGISGRTESGFWMIAALVFWMVLVDLIAGFIHHYSQNPLQKTIKTIWICIPLLLIINWLTNPLAEPKERYQKVRIDTQTAYAALNEPTDHIILIRLPGGTELANPALFWLGNKIYHGLPGLTLSLSRHVFYSSYMNCEFYHNTNNYDFSYFRGFLDNYPSNQGTILLKDQYGYTRLFNNPSKLMLSRRVLFPHQDNFLQLPIYLKETPNQKLQVSLTFDKEISLHRLRWAGQIITDAVIENKLVKFQTSHFGKENELIIETEGGHLTTVEISTSTIPWGTVQETKGYSLTLTSQKHPCGLAIYSEINSVQFNAIINKGTSLTLTPLVPSTLEIYSYPIGTQNPLSKDAYETVDLTQSNMFQVEVCKL